MSSCMAAAVDPETKSDGEDTLPSAAMEEREISASIRSPYHRRPASVWPGRSSTISPARPIFRGSSMGRTIGQRFDIPQVQLLNDLEATAYGLFLLRAEELFVLNAEAAQGQQAIALIAAGTGLGESILFWDGTRYRPMPTEGGHSDFAPNSDIEIDLLRHLRGSYLHVSYERVVSGPGLHAIYEYLRDTKKNEPTWLAEKIKVEDPAATIAQAGLKGEAEIAKQALELFASIYGAEAGNLALKALALDGVYLGGGIAPKLLAKLKDGTFMRGFTNKGRYKRLMNSIPVKVILNNQTALLGAASVAGRLAAAEKL